jgi:hypothetical protein
MIHLVRLGLQRINFKKHTRCQIFLPVIVSLTAFSIISNAFLSAADQQQLLDPIRR